jgi:release factor glutamine methyltransferase
MHSPNKKAFFGGFVFEVCSEVYEPAEDSFLFAENLNVNVGARVLDMGTGSGILGIIAARQASEVLSVDVNPHAVRCAKQNAALNKVAGNMAFMQSDLFAAISETAKFDLILFNAPYLPSEAGEEESWLGRAWAGGTTGREFIDRFIAQAPEHLECGGEILLMQSNLANVEETLVAFASQGLFAEPVARLNLPFFETLVLIRAEEQNQSLDIHC